MSVHVTTGAPLARGDERRELLCRLAPAHQLSEGHRAELKVLVHKIQAACMHAACLSHESRLLMKF